MLSKIEYGSTHLTILSEWISRLTTLHEFSMVSTMRKNKIMNKFELCHLCARTSYIF